MLCPSMEHMIQESHTGPYPYVLGGRYLGRMMGGVLSGDGSIGRREVLIGEDIRVWKMIERTAV